MLVGGNYYAISLSANGASHPAYYSLTPNSSLQISQGGVTLNPTDLSGSMVNIYPQTLQIQAASGMINAGVTIITNEAHIAAAVRVSPAIDVPVLIQVWGNDKLIGTYTLPAGQESGAFDIPVSAADAIPPSEATKIVQRLEQANA